MTELVLAIVVAAWLWRERENARTIQRLTERLTGVSLATPPPHRNRRWTPQREAQVARKQREGFERVALREGD